MEPANLARFYDYGRLDCNIMFDFLYSDREVRYLSQQLKSSEGGSTDKT